MGMAEIQMSTTPRPRYKNTVVCPNCHAEYNPEAKWGWVLYEGTSSHGMLVSRLKEGTCPGCFMPRGVK
jgi:hypothetical protein